MYIMDGYITNKVFCYDTSGTLKFSFGELGGGPGEYNTLTEMIVTDKNIFLSDGTDFRRLCYSLDGSFQYGKKLDFWLYEGIPYEKEQFVVYAPTDLSFDNSMEPNVLKIVDADFEKTIIDYFPYEEAHDDLPFRGFLCSYNNNYSFARSLYNQIFSLDNNYNLRLRYNLDFGSHNWPISAEQISENPAETEKIFRKGGIMSVVHRLLETQGQFVFQTLTMNPEGKNKYGSNYENGWLCIFDKTTEKSYAIDKIVNDLEGGIFTFPIATDGEQFISVLSPEAINDFLAKKSQEKTEDNNSKLSDLAGEQKIFSNPVLMIYRIKSKLDI